MKAIPNNEPYVPPGAVGVLISKLRGTPRHYRYWVKGDDGTLYAYHSIDTYSVGECLRIYVPKAVEKNETWFLGEAAAEAVSSCNEALAIRRGDAP